MTTTTRTLLNRSTLFAALLVSGSVFAGDQDAALLNGTFVQHGSVTLPADLSGDARRGTDYSAKASDAAIVGTFTRDQNGVTLPMDGFRAPDATPAPARIVEFGEAISLNTFIHRDGVVQPATAGELARQGRVEVGEPIIVSTE